MLGMVNTYRAASHVLKGRVGGSGLDFDQLFQEDFVLGVNCALPLSLLLLPLWIVEGVKLNL